MKAVHPARILAVDDSDAHLYFLNRVLSRAGFEVLLASTGRQALELAQQLPDLAILDVRLPDMNGFEICKQLKADANTARIPIVFLSSAHGPADGKARAQFVGAEEFLSHPILPDQLTVIINGVLARQQQRLHEHAS